MPKSNAVRSPAFGLFNTKQSAQAELATFRAVVSGLKKHPGQLRAIAVKAGISTPAGKLKKAYGGK
jgi:hypothetical protein